MPIDKPHYDESGNIDWGKYVFEQGSVLYDNLHGGINPAVIVDILTPYLKDLDKVLDPLKNEDGVVTDPEVLKELEDFTSQVAQAVIGDGNVQDIEDTVTPLLDSLEGFGDYVSDTVEAVSDVAKDLNILTDTTDDDTTQDDFQTTSEPLEVIDGYGDLTEDQQEAVDNAIVAGANIYTGEFGDLNIVFPNVAGGSSASAASNTAASSEDADSASANASADANASASASDDSSAAESKDVTASAGLPGADLPDAGGAGSQTETGSSGGVETKSTGKGSDIIWTENDPFKNDPEGTFGGFILVKQDGTWGESGTTTVQIEGTGVVIDIDWENGTYTSDYVFGNEDDKDEDKGIDTSQTQTPNNTTTGNTTPVITTGAGTTTSGSGGMFSIPDLTDIIGQILINNTIYNPDNNVAGTSTSTNNTTTKQPPVVTSDPSTTFNDLLNTVTDVTKTTIDPNNTTVDNVTTTNAGSGNASGTFTNLLNTVTDKTQGGKSGNGGNGGNGGDGVDGVDGGKNGDGDFPAAGTYAGGYCAAGETLVQSFHDGMGGTYETRTPNSPTCVRKSTTPNGTDTTNTGGNGGGKGPGQGPGDGPGDGDGREPEPEPEPVQQVASPSIPSISFTADGEINYQDPSLVRIIEPAGLGLLGGLASNSMDASADLLGRLSFGSQQPQQFQQGFNQLQGFDQLQGLSNLSMFDNVLRRNYIG